MVATGASKNTTLVFLNSAQDRTSEDNFTIVLTPQAQEALAKAGVTLPRTHFDGKTIRVTGTLSLFSGRPQIVLTEGSKIQAVAAP